MTKKLRRMTNRVEVGEQFIFRRSCLRLEVGDHTRIMRDGVVMRVRILSIDPIHSHVINMAIAWDITCVVEKNLYKMVRQNVDS